MQEEKKHLDSKCMPVAEPEDAESPMDTVGRKIAASDTYFTVQIKL